MAPLLQGVSLGVLGAYVATALKSPFAGDGALRLGGKYKDVDEDVIVDKDVDDGGAGGGGDDERGVLTSAGYGRNCLARHDDEPSEEDLDVEEEHRISWQMRWLRNNSTWVELPLEPGYGAPGADKKPLKLALLFFIKDAMYHAQVWNAWLKKAEDQGLRTALFIHAYGALPNWSLRTPEFNKYVVHKKANTHWCLMVPAEMVLLRAALADPDVTHVVTLSEDTVPVKPASYVFNELEKSPVTRMCGDDNWYKPWPRAESWWIMQRRDVELFEKNEAYSKQLMQEFYISRCTEEQAWYFPLKVRMDRWGEAAEVRNECVTFTDWADGRKACKDWGKNVDLCDCKNLRSGNLTSSGYKHPVVFMSANASGMKELVRSPFWFARKFPEGSLSQDALRFLSAM